MKKITTEQKLHMLKHLVDGLDAGDVAVIMHLERNDVVHAASAHGYPDIKKMAQAAQIVERNLDRERRTIPEAEHRERIRGVQSTPLPEVVEPKPASRPPVAPAPEEPVGPGAYKADFVLRRAAGTGNPRLSKMVDKIWASLSDLEQRLNEHLAREREEAEAKQAREAARLRVEKAKQELAAAQAALRVQSHAVSPKVVREWAKAEGLEVADRGIIADEVREAYARAHQSEAS